MQNRYRLFRRAEDVYYWHDSETGKQGSLKTKIKREAALLLTAKNESKRVSVINLAVGRAYLSAHDSKMTTRTWSDVMAEFGSHGLPTTQERCRRAFKSPVFDLLRTKALVETTAEDFLLIWYLSLGRCLRRVHVCYTGEPRNAVPCLARLRDGISPAEFLKTGASSSGRNHMV